MFGASFTTGIPNVISVQPMPTKQSATGTSARIAMFLILCMFFDFLYHFSYALEQK